jgi:hypothetical protein
MGYKATGGPRRSSSPRSYVRATRAATVVALLVLAAGVVSDSLGGGYWERHGLIAGMTASFIVVLLSVGIVNETIARRARSRWRLLAQYVTLQLVENARLIWTEVVELAGKMPAGMRTDSILNSGAGVVRDTSSLAEAVQEVLNDHDRRERLHEALARFVGVSDEILGRWAAVMLCADDYAELIDRHVELATQISWLDSLLDATDGESDGSDGHGARRNHPAVQFEGKLEDESLASRIVIITQLAEQLDRRTLGFARMIVPLAWWEERLGAITSAGSSVPTVSSTD